MHSFRRFLLLLLAAAAPGFAWATPIVVTSHAIVQQSAPGFPLAAIGAPITGSFTYDLDPSTFTTGTNPVYPGYAFYEYADPSHGTTITLPSSSIALPLLAVEVLDDGSTLFATDTVTFSAKANNIFYSLELSGPDAAFSGSSLLDAAHLAQFWTSARFVVDDGSFHGPGIDLVAIVDRVTVTESVVAEPSVPALLLAAAASGAAFRRRKTRGAG